MNNPNCGACGMLNSRGFCSLTACRFPVVNELGTWQERILADKPKQTNADRVRSMTDEELATWINHMQADAYGHGIMETAIVNYPNTYCNWIGWLRQAAKEGE